MKSPNAAEEAQSLVSWVQIRIHKSSLLQHRKWRGRGPIVNYMAPSSGGIVEKSKNNKKSPTIWKLQVNGVDRTQKLLKYIYIFFTFCALNDYCKNSNKKLCYCPIVFFILFYHNVHKYSIYINTYRTHNRNQCALQRRQKFSHRFLL